MEGDVWEGDDMYTTGWADTDTVTSRGTHERSFSTELETVTVADGTTLWASEDGYVEEYQDRVTIGLTPSPPPI